MCLPDDSAHKQALLAAADEKARQARISAGMGKINSRFDMFNPGYFASRRKQFFDFGVPRVEADYRDARDTSTFALARKGHIGPGGVTSSTALDRMAALLGARRAAREDLMGRAFDFSNRERLGVEGARSRAIAELRAANGADANFSAAGIAGDAYGANPANGPAMNFFANLTGIGADAMNPPTDWRRMTDTLNLSPKSASSIRLVA